MSFSFFVVLVAGYLVGKKHRADSADEFLTGGGNLGWFKTGLTMVAMSIDTGIMRICYSVERRGIGCVAQYYKNIRERLLMIGTMV